MPVDFNTSNLESSYKVVVVAKAATARMKAATCMPRIATAELAGRIKAAHPFAGAGVVPGPPTETVGADRIAAFGRPLRASWALRAAGVLRACEPKREKTKLSDNEKIQWITR
jgi:hypothetical protein